MLKFSTDCNCFIALIIECCYIHRTKIELQQQQLQLQLPRPRRPNNRYYLFDLIFRCIKNKFCELGVANQLASMKMKRSIYACA